MSRDSGQDNGRAAAEGAAAIQVGVRDEGPTGHQLQLGSELIPFTPGANTVVILGVVPLVGELLSTELKHDSASPLNVIVVPNVASAQALMRSDHLRSVVGQDENEGALAVWLSDVNLHGAPSAYRVIKQSLDEVGMQGRYKVFGQTYHDPTTMGYSFADEMFSVYPHPGEDTVRGAIAGFFADHDRERASRGAGGTQDTADIAEVEAGSTSGQKD